MKHFNIDQAQSALWDKHGAFFAFSQEQFDKQRKEGVSYASIIAGLLCPTDTAHKLADELDALYKEKIRWELENNSRKAIIWDHFANDESQIAMDYAGVLEGCETYGISADEIRAEWPGYIQYCIDNDCF